MMAAAVLWLLRLSGPTRRGRALGHIGLANYGGLAIGPLLADLAHGFESVLLLAAALPLLAAAVMPGMRPERAIAAARRRRAPRRHAETGHRPDVREHRLRRLAGVRRRAERARRAGVRGHCDRRAHPRRGDPGPRSALARRSLVAAPTAAVGCWSLVGLVGRCSASSCSAPGRRSRSRHWACSRSPTSSPPATERPPGCSSRGSTRGSDWAGRQPVFSPRSADLPVRSSVRRRRSPAPRRLPYFRLAGRDAAP